MLNVCFVDNFNELNNNGLDTYTAELINVLSTYKSTQASIIWINSTKYHNLTKYHHNGIEHIHVPHAKFPLKQGDLDIALTQIIVDIIKAKENVIIHLNWINHLSLAWHLKQKINCKIILTKHCLPWRDFVTSRYKEFYDTTGPVTTLEAISEDANSGHTEDYHSVIERSYSLSSYHLAEHPRWGANGNGFYRPY